MTSTKGRETDATGNGTEDIEWQTGVTDDAPRPAPELADVPIKPTEHRTHIGTWLLVLTLISLASYGVIVIVVFTANDKVDGLTFLGLLGLLAGLNFLASCFIFVFVRWVMLTKWAKLTPQEYLEVLGDRAHLPANWLQSLLDRDGLKMKIKITDVLCRKGGHLWVNGVNYLVISPFFANGNTTEMLLAGMTGVTALALLRAAVYYFFPASTHPKSWRWFTILWGGGDRLRDGRYALVNLMTAGVSGNLGIMSAYGLGMVFLGQEDSNKELWKIVLKLVTMPQTFGDALGEIIGTPFGRHQFAVRGFGEINKKSLEGCAAVFLGSLVPDLIVTFTSKGQDGGDLLMTTKIVLPILIAFAVTLVETFSFRSTDNFTIPIAAALTCALWHISVGI